MEMVSIAILAFGAAVIASMTSVMIVRMVVRPPLRLKVGSVCVEGRTPEDIRALLQVARELYGVNL